MSEQGHAAATKLNRLHKEYNTGTLTARACLISMSPLMRTSNEEKTLARAECKLDALRRKNPNKINARTAYVKGLIGEASLLKKRGRAVPSQQKMIAGCGALWNGLSKERRSSFIASAEQLRDDKKAELDEHIEDAQSSLKRARSRVEIESTNADTPVAVSKCRLSSSEVQGCEEALKNAKFHGLSLQSLRDAAILPPQAPNDAAKALIMSKAQKQPERPKQPSWVRSVCVGRQHFHDSVWKLEPVDGDRQFLKFAFACQSPQFVCFIVVEPVTAVGSSSSLDCGNLDEQALASWGHTFSVPPHPQIQLSGALSGIDEEHIEILSDSFFKAGMMLVSDGSWQSLAGFISMLDLPESRPAKSHIPSDSTSLKDLVANHPWIADLMHKPVILPLENHSSSSAGSGASSSTDAAPAGDQDPIDVVGVYEELRQKRAEMMADDGSSTSSFLVKLLGGARAKVKLGTAVEAWAGKVDQGSQAETFCRLHLLHLSAQFSIRVYGSDEALVLSKEWCARMQFLFSLWLTQGAEGKLVCTAAAMYNYTESPEFTALAADATGELKTRVAKLRNLKPI